MLSVFSTLIVGCSKEDFEETTPTGLPTPKANEIYYTTTNGKFLDLSSKKWFNTTVTSHTVKNDSIFVLTFIKDLEEIEDDMFNFDYTNMSQKLKSIRLPESVGHIGQSAFFCNYKLISVNIPNKVTAIEDRAFSNCRALEHIVIPNKVTKIGTDAFQNCIKLSSVMIPSSVESLGDGCFRCCRNLSEFDGKFVSDDKRCLIYDRKLVSFAPQNITNYVIHGGVTIIGYGAFHSCNLLKEVTIPENVTEIEDLAFTECQNLTTVYCKSTVPPKMKETNSNFDFTTPIRKIYVPSASVEKYKTAQEWSRYADIIEGYNF